MTPLRKFGHFLKEIRGREVLDSRGLPTVEAEVITEQGVFRSIVPSGASTGIFEALELRDGDKSRFLGKGVSKAVNNINKVIGPALVGQQQLNITDQESWDKFMVEELDGSKNEYGWNKNKLGANSILAVSMAIARAGAAYKEIPLYRHISELAGKSQSDGGQFVMPVPCFNVINGGKHAGNTLPHQEFMLVPSGASSFREAVRMGCEVYQTLKGIIKDKYGSQNTSVGDEGGFAPSVKNEIEALDLIMEAIAKAGYTGKINIALDVAASEMWNEEQGKYDIDFKITSNKKHRLKSSSSMLNIYASLVEQYPIVSIEDPFDQQDWRSWKLMTRRFNTKVQVVGDDLLVTNPQRIEMAVKAKSCNALLLKVNQIGTITESIKACQLAQKKKWGVMVSHRSGETEDDFIADLVVGLKTGQIKTGAPCRGERTAKYNQLLRIEEQLGKNAIYNGKII